jgi:hypothetical protein
MRSLTLGVVFRLVARTAVAADWGKLATISNSMSGSASRLCLGEGSRGDIGCPAYAPSVTTADDVSISGNVSANKFIGYGSELSGVSGVSVTSGVNRSSTTN